MIPQTVVVLIMTDNILFIVLLAVKKSAVFIAVDSQVRLVASYDTSHLGIDGSLNSLEGSSSIIMVNGTHYRLSSPQRLGCSKLSQTAYPLQTPSPQATQTPTEEEKCRHGIIFKFHLYSFFRRVDESERVDEKL